MSAAARAGRLAAALLALGASGCGKGGSDPGGAPLEVTVGGKALQLVSGGVFRTNGQLRIHLTSSLDSCAAVNAIPVMTTTYLSFTVQPPTAGALAAAVLETANALQPGQATGRIQQQTGGAVTWAGFAASDGTLRWSGGATGDLTLEAIDVGFAGAAGRVTATGLLLRACN